METNHKIQRHPVKLQFVCISKATKQCKQLLLNTNTGSNIIATNQGLIKKYNTNCEIHGHHVMDF